MIVASAAVFEVILALIVAVVLPLLVIKKFQKGSKYKNIIALLVVGVQLFLAVTIYYTDTHNNVGEQLVRTFLLFLLFIGITVSVVTSAKNR